MARHCEFVECPDDREADAPPLYCGFSDAPDAGKEDNTSYPPTSDEELASLIGQLEDYEREPEGEDPNT